MRSMIMSVIRWFIAPNADIESISMLQRIGGVFLVIGTILLPLQVGQGAFFLAFTSSGRMDSSE